MNREKTLYDARDFEPDGYHGYSTGEKKEETMTSEEHKKNAENEIKTLIEGYVEESLAGKMGGKNVGSPL